MSLILEALRKSEAERRRGQVPDLHAERAPAATATRASAPAWPWLALALVAAVALAWLARGAWSPTPDSGASWPSDQPQAAVSDEGVAAGGRDARTDRGVAAAPLSADPARTPLDPAPPADTPSTPRSGADPIAASGDTAALLPRIAPINAPISVPVAAAQGDSAADAGSAMGPRPPTVVARPAPRAAVVPLPISGVAAVAPGTAPAIAAPAAPTAAADRNRPLRLSDLSTAERLELPPLKISMHLWDPSPARRFAIIDGARVNEGDRIGDAVVDEITANAVLLAWRGQQLQIPMR